MDAVDRQGYILGLDIGVASIGWVRIGLNSSNQPASILQLGVHTFDAGVEGDVESGRDESRGRARREARMPRRMHWRRQRRRKKLLRILQRARLMPPGETGSAQAIHNYLLAVDAQLRQKHLANSDRVAAHVLPYRLRSMALDRELEPFELGRALYHLAQRRGFLSNRKSLKKDEDEGVVKKGISDLQSAMNAVNARTLGEYFAGLDPEAERIRRRWTARSMYVDEFEKIWTAQVRHHPALLTEALKAEISRAIFFQRPLKSARHFIGRCELVPGARRAPLADRLFQQFRILQNVNNLTTLLPNGSTLPLSGQERQTVIAALSRDGDLTFAKIKGKSVLGLPKGTDLKLWSQDEEKKLPGHRTDERMRSVFGERWDQMPETEPDAVVLEILSFQNPDALARRAIKAWGMDERSARALAEMRLEQGYAAHSRRAIRRLVERMKDGTRYATARRELFPESFQSTEPIDRLPPVLRAVSSLRNPAVARALTELRKLINEVVRVHGKPQQIRIELARDLKRARKERERMSKEIDARTKLRDKAKARILREAGISEPRASDIEKALLWEECGGRCPFTGRSIEFAGLFGANPQFDIEHILPFSRSLDNSFNNKTLCYHQENRDLKRNRTPFEAYGRNQVQYHEILARVRTFQGKVAARKLQRFEMQEIPDDFVNRQLSDTRYASRLAADYLALLYGGRVDESGRQRIQISTGGITFHLRNEWMLNSILGDGGEKTRDDHRHHAVDAIAVALASPLLVHELQRAAERATGAGRRLFAVVPEPWVDFLEQARHMVKSINVSRRTTKRVAGELHAGSLYGKPMPTPNGATRVHLRKELHKLSATDLKKGRIVDPQVRAAVMQKWEALGKGDPKKVFLDSETHPFLMTRSGRSIPIHKVRVSTGVKPWSVGEGERQRHVTSKAGTNHHTVIVATIDRKGRERWEDRPVSRFEVYGRRARGEPIVQTEWGPGCDFKFSLAPDEHIVMRDHRGHEQLYCVASVSQGDIEFSLHCDARTQDERKKAKARMRGGGEKLRKYSARKVRVTYLGEIVPAND